MRGVILTAIALGFAGCGLSTTRTVTHTVTHTATVVETVTDTATTTEASVPIGGGRCSVYKAGTGLSVVARGAEARGACDQLIAGSDATQLWSYGGRAYHAIVVCRLENAGTSITVFDTGALVQGRSYCGTLVGRGWREH